MEATINTPREMRDGSQQLDWELILDSLKDLAASAAKSTLAICEEELMEDRVGDPDELVKRILYNNIGAVIDLYKQFQLLPMPEWMREQLDRNTYLQWTTKEVAHRLSRKARSRWLRIRYILHNKSARIQGMPDFDVNDFSQF